MEMYTCFQLKALFLVAYSSFLLMVRMEYSSPPMELPYLQYQLPMQLHLQINVEIHLRLQLRL